MAKVSWEQAFDWELGLYHAVRAVWARLRPAPAGRPAGEVALVDVAGRLEALATLVAGRPVTVVGGDGAGGIRGDTLVLPARLATGARPEDAVKTYVLRVVLDATTLARGEPRPAEAERLAASVAAAARSVAELDGTLPGFGPAFDAWVDAAPGAPGWLVALRHRTPILTEASAGDFLAWPIAGRLLRQDGAGGPVVDAGEPARPAPTSEHAARAPEDVTVRTLRPEDDRELPVHVFEKVETAEAFQGALRQLDGSDELDEHLDALDEVDLGALLRGGPEAHSALRAEVGLDADIPDVATIGADEPCVLVDEWDHRKTAYRRGWCRVVPTPVRAADPAWAAEARVRLRPVVDRVHRVLLAVRAARAARPRVLDGDELDLDALVAARGDLASGRTPDPRVFVDRPPGARSLALLVLVDTSLSSDAWVDGRRVLDVTRDAVFALGEVADRLGDALQVQAFASMTRNKVRVYDVRAPHEPWSLGAARLGALRPVGYTRIGPALRHAASTLAKIPADRRVLVLVSDGRPTDYDRYEGAYGVADVRRALVEAHERGIVAHALTVDRAARGHVAHMFGAGSWDLLPEPAALPGALTRLLVRLG